MCVLYIANRPKYCHNLMQGLAWATETCMVHTYSVATQKKIKLNTQSEGSINFSSEFLSKFS